MTMCKKAVWHPTGQCEDTDKIKARRFRKLKSDLFKIRGCEPPTLQKKRMIRNSNIPFLRLPPEIRLRIYALILGNQEIWIGHTRELRKWNFVKDARHESGLGSTKEKFHLSGAFYHVTGRECPDPALDLRLLRTCRQVYSETALLPYSLNRFTFEDDVVRKRFERSARAGKKRAQKKAVGKYEVRTLSDLYDSDEGRTKWHREGLHKWHELLTMPRRRVIGPDFLVPRNSTWTCDGWHTPES